MELQLKDILNLTEDEIKNSKIEFNMNAGQGGESIIDRWLKHSESDKSKGICNDCSYWGWFQDKRNFQPEQTVFSFVRLNSIDEWLFISAATIKDIPENAFANVTIIKKYEPLFGRLVIKCNKGNTYSRYVFNLKKFLDNSTVKEILPCVYSGESFEGYDKVNLPYSKLAGIFSGKIMPTYLEALKKITGVYCLTDKKTGKLYIGSATGTEGVAQRWGNYFDSKHGGNVKLIELYEKEGDKYFEKFFTYTIIEYFGLHYDPEKIKQREQYWKKCFDTISHGYNDN